MGLWDEYNKFSRDYAAQHGSDKHSFMLAASALVAAAGEPESKLEGCQIEAPVPVAIVGRSNSTRAEM